jgi:hypothetical protein
MGLYMHAPLMKKRVLLLPLMGDEKLCDGLSEALVVAVVQASTYSVCAAYHSDV